MVMLMAVAAAAAGVVVVVLAGVAQLQLREEQERGGGEGVVEEADESLKARHIHKRAQPLHQMPAVPQALLLLLLE